MVALCRSGNVIPESLALRTLPAALVYVDRDGTSHALNERAQVWIASERSAPLEAYIRAGRRFEWHDEESIVLAEQATSGLLILVVPVDELIRQIRQQWRKEHSLEVGKLAARVAHELNNPLDGIIRFINLARGQIASSGSSAESYLDQALHGLTRMSQTVSTLLEFSRHRVVSVQPSRLGKMLKHCTALFEAMAADRNVDLVCHDATESTLLCPGQLEQVLSNLIKNGIEAMPRGGILEIDVTGDAADVIITVADRGIGLPGGTESQMFEPFFTTKPQGEGAGLGLAISREILGRLGGTIDAVDRQGGGAIFTVRLPYDEGV